MSSGTRRNVMRAIFYSAKKAWHGEEKLWIVFWGWLVLFQLIILCICKIFPFISLNYLLSFHASSPVKDIAYVDFVIFLDMLYGSAYALFLAIAMWKCSRNTSHKIWFYLSRIFIFVITLLLIYSDIELIIDLVSHTRAVLAVMD